MGRRGYPPEFRRKVLDLLTAASGTAVFFCDPASPWQRGSNENTNRLLRQYLARNADLRALTQRDLDDIAARINARPRRVLGWDSATDRYQRLLTVHRTPARPAGDGSCDLSPRRSGVPSR